ncbi:unnamed protein product [Thelazia callipaeda]|uniref:Calmodulin n=1 Tax=Thelazia callipaeda TaxID=103827 RepID=A0A0N5CRG5_THECL|nr:unnamed protein product [Thelazia callipaeda]
MAEKDMIFWDAILDKNRSKKKTKKFKKYAKDINLANLAEQFSITEQEVEDIYGVFMRIDDDRSGVITAAEIAQGLNSFGCDVSPKVVQAVMRTTDKDGNGEINFEEFLVVIVSRTKVLLYSIVTTETLQDAWLSAVGSRITAEEANAILALAEGSDGQATREQLLKLCQ